MIPPFTTYKQIYPNDTIVVEGMLKDILDHLAAKMEFKYTVKRPSDGQWGAPKNGSAHFSGCVGEVQAKTALIGGGPFTKTHVRDGVIDYTKALFEEANAVLLRRPAPASRFWNVFEPFQTSVWLLTLGAVLVAAVTTFILAYFSPFTAWNLRLEHAIADEIWFQEYVWSILGSFLQQGQDFYPLASSPRTVLAFWWMLTVILFGTYTGDLTAHLTISKTTVPIKNLEDLSKAVSITPYLPEGTNVDTLFRESKNEIYSKLNKRAAYVNSITDCADKIKTDIKAGCITDYTFLLYKAKVECNEVYLVEELFNTATVAFVVEEDAFFLQLIDFYLLKLHESGVMSHLFNKYWSSDTVCSNGQAKAEAAPITMEEVGGAYIITGGLYIVGSLLLIFEFVWSKGFKKSTHNCCLY